MQWYYWVILLGVLAVMYVLLIVRQKKQEKQSKEILESFKVGDKVITHIGIYGKIKRIYNTSYGKVCVLEVGTQEKLDIELDMRYIAGKDEKVAVADDPKPEQPKQEEVVSTDPEQPKQEEVKTKPVSKKSKKQKSE